MDDYLVIKIDAVTRIVTLEPPFNPKKATGLLKLVQIVYMALMNSPGRNASYPDDGSGLKELIGQANLSSTDSTETLGLVNERIEKIKEEILDHQNALEDEDPSERLQDFVAINIAEGINIDQVVVKFRLISEAGDEANFAI